MMNTLHTWAASALTNLTLALEDPAKAADPKAAAPVGPTPAAPAVDYGEQAIQMAKLYGPRVLGALAILVGTFFIASWIRRSVIAGLSRAHVDTTLARFIGGAAKWLAVVIGVGFVLDTFGFSVASLAALLGTVGVAIGLALQGSLSHFAAGVLLLLFRPFKVGDAVVVAGQTGVVDAIDLFSTTLDTGDNRRILIPNGAIMGNVIENSTYHPTRWAEFSFQVDGKVPIDAVRASIDRAIQKVKAQLGGVVPNPPPDVILNALHPANGQQWTIRVNCQTPVMFQVRNALAQAVKEEIEKI